MAAKLTRSIHNIAIQLHLVAESCTICSSRSRSPVRKLLVTPSYIHSHNTHSWRDAKLKAQGQHFITFYLHRIVNNACCHSFHNLVSFSLIFKVLNMGPNLTGCPVASSAVVLFSRRILWLCLCTNFISSSVVEIIYLPLNV
jgi:hypothetical protein